jgi:hypothetical protein
MRAQPVDLIGGFYTDDALPWARQDTVNWLPVAAEVAGTLTVKYLKTPPGLKPYQNVGTGPIRGVHDMEGVQFVVSGRYLYRISPAGVGIQVGVIPGVGRVSMNHNQFKTGYQLLVENGLGGGGYVYDSTTQLMSRITDPGYPGSISSDYLDSYFLGVEPKGRFWFHSNLADATDFNTLDRYESEASPDRIVGLAVSQFEVVVFNQRTIEFFYNSGAQTGTFQNRRQTITRGCASRHTIAKLDNTLFWLGDDGIVYRMAGYSAQPVSTGPMHRAFAGLNWAEASAFVWEDEGFKVYYLTFPDGRTWGYDVVSGLWTRRESYGLDRWRVANTVKWASKWYAGDYRGGQLWELNWDYVLEGDQEFVSTRISPVMSDNQSRLIVNSAELIFDTGQGPLTEPIAFPIQPDPPAISGDAPNGITGFPYGPYAYTITAGSNPIVSVKVVSGALPAGMALSNAGVLSATMLTENSESTFTVRVTDSVGMYADIQDKITVRVAIVGDVFQVNLYTGNGVQPRALTTLDFSRGGSYLVRPRAVGWSHMMWANAPGPANMKSFAGSATEGPSINQITANGVTINTALLNTLGTNYFGYSFANFAKFAKTVTWVGDGNTTKDIAHGLGIVPGAILVIHPANANYIDMYHRSLGPTQYLPMNSGNTLTTTPTAWGDTAPNATTFRVGSRYNATSVVYTALVLAHDDTATGMIQCGSYVGNGAAAGPAVSLGWQPQMLLVKAITGGATQFMTDTTRSPGFTGNDELAYISVSNNVSNNFNLYELIPGGFRPGSTFSESNANGATHIYIAVRAP